MIIIIMITIIIFVLITIMIVKILITIRILITKKDNNNYKNFRLKWEKAIFSESFLFLCGNQFWERYLQWSSYTSIQ